MIDETFACAETYSGTEVYWDVFGIPHIYAPTNEALFFAYGWVQARAHASLLLRMYGQSRGRGAEYWGEPYIKSDEWVHTVGIPQRGMVWYEAQDSRFKKCLDAFAEGINVFFHEN